MEKLEEKYSRYQKKVQDHKLDRVKINVGGTHFETCISTLTKENSVLAALVHANTDGSIFIDRSPKYFGEILNYLRTGRFRRLEVPKNCRMVIELPTFFS
eukprot:TRINITY_DN3157_c0_g1_i3.p1 TRINITY_DN3157_c0_g1~~TRINITY_DN3157_c0_g1_i3.p1  ORF type:complete len:100 (-),score=12.65 TRINITY_DN3157_c0_g1_i3:33-332(-)